MKLYATVTSERASKGQGGKRLEINIKNEKKENAMQIVIDTDMFGKVRAGVFYDIRRSYEPKTTPNFLEEKPKRHDKIAPCMNCGSIQKEKDIQYLGDEKWKCPACSKPKRQTGVCWICKKPAEAGLCADCIPF